MRKLWWIDLWNQHFADLAELGLPVDEVSRNEEFDAFDAREAEDANMGWGWKAAIDSARAGEWEALDRLVESEALPPPSLWPALELFFADPPPRGRGKKPRLDETTAQSIRYRFEHYTTQPMDVVDDAGRKLATTPPMKPMEAYRTIAEEWAMSWEAVRDVVRQRHTYKRA